MGDGVWIDADAVSGAAMVMSDSAEAVSKAAGVVDTPVFGRGAAGRAYGDLGAQVVEGYRRIGDAVRAWSSAGADVADALHAAVVRYSSGDDAAAVELDRAGGRR